MSSADLPAGLLDYWPDDGVARVAADANLAALQQRFARDQLFWPTDPPQPARWTVAPLLHAAPTGPLRLGFGPLRDQVIGATYALPDGVPRRSGARVAKSVAGLPMHRLLVGAGGAVATVLDATIRLRPLWRDLAVVHAPLGDAAAIEPALAAVMASDLRPIFLEVTAGPEGLAVHAGFGDVPSAVAWQADEAARLLPGATRLHGDDARRAYETLRDRLAGDGPTDRLIQVASVRSSQVGPLVQAWLAAARAVGAELSVQARAACGVVLARPVSDAPALAPALASALGQVAGPDAVLRPAYARPDTQGPWIAEINALLAKVT